MNRLYNSNFPTTIFPAKTFDPAAPLDRSEKLKADGHFTNSPIHRSHAFAFIGIIIAAIVLLLANDVRAQGALTNGWTHTGTISPVGDFDSWTFSANAGDSIVIRVGEITQTNNFTPRIRLFNPNATQQALVASAVVAEIAVTATNTGTFTVIVDDEFSTLATGTYRLTLAKSPGSVSVAPGDEGGPMTNGVMHTGTIDVGDLDVWTFNANSGDAIIVRMGEVVDTSGNFEPWVRLYGPNGKLLDSGFGTSAGEVTVTATNSGTFIAVVGDGNGALSGTGNYRLTLAKTGDPVVVSPGDEGGPMTNGVMHTGTISTGDLDMWTFTANSGDAIIVRMGEVVDTSGNFEPWVRLYGPNGKLLDSGFGTSAGEVTVTATNSGSFLVVVGDGNGALSGSGNYRLTLAKTGDPVVVSPGDEGGALNGADTYDGTIDVGDLDAWTFTACAGDAVLLRMDELVSGGGLTPWIRLYGRDGTLLNSIAGATTAQVDRSAPVTGRYLVVLGDDTGGLGGSGTYRLTVNGLNDGLKLCTPIISGTNLNLGGVGGSPGTGFTLFTATNITTPFTLWSSILTNQFDLYGVFSHTNTFSAAPQQYFRLLLQ